MGFLQALPRSSGLLLLSVALACATDYITDSMREDVKKLKEHFGTKEGDKALFGNPVFLRDLENLDSKYEEGSQKLLVHEILDAYVSILSAMMKQTKDEDARLSIAALSGRMESLKSRFCKSDDLKKKLQNIWAIEMGDATVQRKALLELMAVFQKASKLNSKIQERRQNRRKRRQVRRSRGRPV